MQFGQAGETLRMAFESLRSNRMRSLLTILGVVIGVSTVIIISSIITGLNNKVSTFADLYGSNTINAYYLPIAGPPTPELLARRYLTVEEAEAMRSLPHVVAVDPGLRYQDPNYGVGQESVKYRGKSIQNTLVQGSSYQMPATVDLPMTHGTYFTQQQDEARANVVMLAHDTAEKLFGEENPVGKEVEIRGELFTVLGVFAKSPSLFGSGANPEDNKVILPYNTFRKILPNVKDVWITVRYDEPKNLALVEEEMRTVLRIARKVPVQKDDDFEIFTLEILVRFWKQITGGLVIFMIAVSSVGLMVGGVGVMNIMLVSVTERTREIGVRKAIGATRNGILLQFTAEAVTLCALGGAIGVLLGGAVTLLIHALVTALPATMSTLWTTISFSSSCLIGLVFGIYPAWKAATLNPIEALRYE